jgi:hypothetical protein
MVLAQLLSLAPRAVRGSIETRITKLTPSKAGKVYTLTDVQARIEELLTAGAADAAAQFMAVEQELGTWGKVAGRDVVRLRANLRLQFLRGEWDAILNTNPPQDLNQLDRESASDTIAFYKALATLKKPGGDLAAVEGLFGQLHSRRPDVPAYAINLFATRVSILLRGDLFMQLRGADAYRGRQVLGEAEQMIGRLRALTPSDAEGVTFNKALLLLALGQAQQAFELLTPLRANRSRDTVSAYTAVALSRMDRVADAVAVLNAADETFGRTEVLRAARAHIGEGTPFPSVATLSSDSDRLTQVKLAFLDFRQMDHMRQAAVLQPQGESFANLVIEHVRAATSSVISMVPMMKGGTERPYEDNITVLICRLLQSRVHFLGWSFPDQSQGGYTERENPGRRDLLLLKDSTELAVFEAVVCDRPVSQEWTRGELKSHFQRLFSYSNCGLFFLLVYAYIDDLASIKRQLEVTAEQEAPSGFTYLDREDIVFTDSRPTGLIARYAGNLGDVKVTFLILDLGQHLQRQAAKTAAQSNPRRAPSRRG